jgi:hypothetical protein
VSEHVEIQAPAATVKVGRGAKIPADTAPAVIEEIRRLLLAEDAMLSVAMWARSHPSLAGHPLDRRTRMVSAAGMVTTFWRPFSADNKGQRLDPAEWRARIENDPKQAEMFDRLELRRNKVLAHSDTDAAVLNVTDTHNFLAPRKPDDPLVLRVYDVGADQGLLEPESLLVIAKLADRLAELFSERMVELGASRVDALVADDSSAAKDS